MPSHLLLTLGGGDGDTPYMLLRTLKMHVTHIAAHIAAYQFLNF